MLDLAVRRDDSARTVAVVGRDDLGGRAGRRGTAHPDELTALQQAGDLLRDVVEERGPAGPRIPVGGLRPQKSYEHPVPYGEPGARPVRHGEAAQDRTGVASFRRSR
ncbi:MULTISPECIES: hypothetical protein [Streptomyces]|uniref:Uncharacterized protein n=2 Tax=Streptomyces TaxID=1883 RepID=A0ABV9INB4_9ACTN